MSTAYEKRKKKVVSNLKKEIQILKNENRSLMSQLTEANKASSISLLKLLNAHNESTEGSYLPKAYIMSPQVHSNLRNIPSYLQCVEYSSMKPPIEYIFGCKVIADPNITGWCLLNEH